MSRTAASFLATTSAGSANRAAPPCQYLSDPRLRNLPAAQAARPPTSFTPPGRQSLEGPFSPPPPCSGILPALDVRFRAILRSPS